MLTITLSMQNALPQADLGVAPSCNTFFRQVGGTAGAAMFLYTGTTRIIAYVDTQTGVPIDETIAEQVVVNVAAGAQTLSLIPVLALDFHVTPASATYLAGKARTAGELLTLMTVIVPVALAVIGAILLGIAILRRRKPATAPASARAVGDAQESQAREAAEGQARP